MSTARKIILGILLFIIYDVVILKNPNAFFSGLTDFSVVANYLVSLVALAFFISTIDCLYQKDVFRNLGYILLFVPIILQTTHYMLYNSPINAASIHTFVREPVHSLQNGWENLNWPKVFSCASFCVILEFLFSAKTSGGNPSLGKLFAYFGIFSLLILLCGTTSYFVLTKQNGLVSFYAAIPETVKEFVSAHEAADHAQKEVIAAPQLPQLDETNSVELNKKLDNELNEDGAVTR